MQLREFKILFQGTDTSKRCLKYILGSIITAKYGKMKLYWNGEGRDVRKTESAHLVRIRNSWLFHPRKIKASQRQGSYKFRRVINTKEVNTRRIRMLEEE